MSCCRSSGAKPLVLLALACAARPLCAEDVGGLELDAIYIVDPGTNLRGGAEKGDAWSHLGRVGALWNAAMADGEPHAVTRASVMYMRGRGISSRTADLQGINNIEAPEGVRLYELWSEFRFGTGASLRAGFLDLNAEFDVPETSALFVSPPHGIGSELAMSGHNGPAIWPATGLGLRLQSAQDGLQWRVAAFEGEPGNPDATPFARVRLTRKEGMLLAAEIAWTPEFANKLQLGAWQYTARFDSVDPATLGQRKHGNRGAYGLADLPIARKGATRIDGALRVGVAAESFNPVDRYLGAVVVVSGLGESLPDDALGIGIAHASTTKGWRDSSALEGAAPLRSETAFEITWRHPLTRYITLQPHLHYVPHPGADDGQRGAWAVGMRLEASASTPQLNTD